MPSAKSGGLRAGEKRRAAKEALQERHARWNAADLRAFARLPKREETSAGAYLAGLERLRMVVDRAGKNPALTPQQRHEMVGRHAAALTKAADAGKIIAELGAELRAAEAVIKSLEAKLHAARTAARSASGDPAPAVERPARLC